MKRVLVFAMFAFAFAGCDIEHKIRRMLSDRGERTAPPISKEKPPDSRLRTTEPNNVSERASLFELGKELRVIEGELAAGDLVDWIEISSNEDTRFELVVEAEAELDVSVHLQVGEDTITQNEGEAGKKERIRNVALPLRFAVRSEAGEGKFYVRLNRAIDIGATEQEPNDIAQNASRLEVPSLTRGFADRSDDRDVFKIDTGEVITSVVIRGIENTLHNVRFFSDAKLTNAVNLYTVPPNRPITIPAVRGSYFIALSTPGDARDGTYSVQLAPVEPGHELTVETEPNDSSPFAIEANDVVRGTFERPVDIDQFTFKPSTVPSDAPIVEGVGKKPPTQTGYVVEVTPDKSLWVGGIAANKSYKAARIGEPLTLCGITTEVPFFELHPIDAVDGGVFSYDVVVRPAGDVEPNDTFENADTLADKRTGVLSPDDVDLFGFRTEGGAVAIKLRVEGQSDVKLSLMDDEAGLIASNNERSVSVDLPAGLYYVKVETNNGASCNAYEISLTSNVKNTPN